MIELDASLHSLLDWTFSFKKSKKPLFWYLNFGFSKKLPPYHLNAPLASYLIAVETFAQTCFKPYKDETEGVYLFRGSLEEALSMQWDASSESDFLSWKKGLPNMKHLKDVYSMLAFSNYLHLLAAALPERLKVLMSLDVQGAFSPSRLAQLLSCEHFSHINIVVTGTDFPIRGGGKNGGKVPTLGVVFPKLIKSSETVLDQIDKIMQTLQDNNFSFKMIAESHLTEQWDHLDHIIVLSHALTSEGIRKMQGFNAAGGIAVIWGDLLGLADEMSLKDFFYKIGVEGFEPPTYCSQSSRASQAALYPEN